MAEAAEPLLRVDGLRTHFAVGGGGLRGEARALRAVDGVSFTLEAGETLAVVGESGCGKSTLARSIVRLEKPTEGRVIFRGRDIAAMSQREFRGVRRSIQMVFQDPWSSLNPRFTVRRIISEAWRVHPDVVPKADRAKRIEELLELVGLGPQHTNSYPHQLSGGQRQRVGIARALALEPEIIVCDESVSALDVSIQAQVLNLLKWLQDEFGVAYIFISHDLSVIRQIADRVAVMYLGKVVELGTEGLVYESPSHPYTEMLLSAVPVPDPEARKEPGEHVSRGEIPSPLDPPSGCHFRTRCPRAEPICAEQEPALLDHAGIGRLSACHFAGDLRGGVPTSRST